MLHNEDLVDKYPGFPTDWNCDLIYSWKLCAKLNQTQFGTDEQTERFMP